MIPRLYLPEVIDGALCRLSAAQSRYLLRVLRLSVGDDARVFDGAGQEYDGRIEMADKRGAFVRIGRRLPPSLADADLRVEIAQAICAPPKMDWAVEKMTELGAAVIVPLITAHAESPRHAALERWQRLAVAACAQCGRAKMPHFSAPTLLTDFLSTQTDEESQKILLTPRADCHLSAICKKTGRIIFMVGPEAGLSAAEEQVAMAAGFTAAHLGARILRAETAALVALAMTQAA